MDEALRRFIDLVDHRERDALGPARDMYFNLGRAELREGRELLGEELDDPESRFELELALRVARSEMR